MVIIPSFFALLSRALLGAQAFGLNEISGRVDTSTTGDKKCGTLMCISATVNGSNVEYVLSSTGKRTLGWMGMGFGRQMSNTPMVIMWLNADGSMTLSQRITPAEVMPTLDLNPPRIATLAPSISITSGSTPSFGYTIPSNGDTKQFVIYAYSTEVPGSSTANAELVQHLDFGTFQLDLTKAASTSTPLIPQSTPTGDPHSTSDTSPLDDTPLLPYQRLIFAHAIFCVVGFLLFLPAGVLLARYLRSSTPAWFMSHWIVQFLAGAPIIAGIALGVKSIDKAGAVHLNDNHKKLGIALFILYLVQCCLGAAIHWLNPKAKATRPKQNYLHAMIGLVIIALGLYQVYDGFNNEWPRTTGREPISSGVTTLFWVWLAILPISYFVGLFFLPKQFRQEKEHQRKLLLQVEDLGMTDVHVYRDQD